MTAAPVADNPIANLGKFTNMVSVDDLLSQINADKNKSQDSLKDILQQVLSASLSDEATKEIYKKGDLLTDPTSFVNKVLLHVYNDLSR